MTSASIHKILPLSSKVLVANSGVGFEALIHGKQVYSFAASEYELATYVLSSLEQIEQVFLNVDQINNTWINKFVYHYLKNCCFDARNSNDIDDKLSCSVASVLNNTWSELAPKHQSALLKIKG